MFKEYKDIFGAPNTGVHKHRFLGLASIDLLMTILASGIIAYTYNTSLLLVFSIIFILGQFLHLIFGVNTAFIAKTSNIHDCLHQKIV